MSHWNNRKKTPSLRLMKMSVNQRFQMRNPKLNRNSAVTVRLLLYLRLMLSKEERSSLLFFAFLVSRCIHMVSIRWLSCFDDIRVTLLFHGSLTLRRQHEKKRNVVSYFNACCYLEYASQNFNFAPWTCMELCLFIITCACSRYNAYSDWIILGHYSPVMLTGPITSWQKPW